jgi:quercetin dioxygenase-like cupin family protein
MKTKSDSFLAASNLPWEYAGEGMSRQIMGYDGQLMLVKVKFEQGAVGTMHTHYHSQGTYVASGRFEVTIGGKTSVLAAGDGFYVEPDVLHGCVCLEAGVLLDTFSPMRGDFLK